MLIGAILYVFYLKRVLATNEWLHVEILDREICKKLFVI